jgi:hypothetical protein
MNGTGRQGQENGAFVIVFSYFFREKKTKGVKMNKGYGLGGIN